MMAAEVVKFVGEEIGEVVLNAMESQAPTVTVAGDAGIADVGADQQSDDPESMREIVGNVVVSDEGPLACSAVEGVSLGPVDAGVGVPVAPRRTVKGDDKIVGGGVPRDPLEDGPADSRGWHFGEEISFDGQCLRDAFGIMG